jgi:ABC-type dipeptide/oligopeptide/nickel transport system permease component
MVNVIRSDFVRTARAKGLVERRIVTRHVMKNTLIPVVTVIGPVLA